MEINFQVQGQWKVDIALCFAWEKEGVEDACHFIQQHAPWVSIAPAWRDFHGKKEEKIVLYGPPAMDISRIMIVGLGNAKKANAETLRFAFAKALKACQAMGLEQVGIDIVSLRRVATMLGFQGQEIVREIALASHLALYSYEEFKSKSEEVKEAIRKVTFLLDDEFCDEAVRDAVRFAEAEASGINFARNLINAPGNALTPSIFADKAEALAHEYKFACTVLNPSDMDAENMHSLLAVAQGSAQEARFVVIEHNPENSDEAPYVFVGKGVTFDAGGISLKPSSGMEEMKGDMSGAAAVLGTFECLGQLSLLGNAPKRRIIGILPLVENLPSGTAIKPGDIVTSKKGTSIEIINTDAEGRLILIDALTYAQEKYNPAYLVDIATLTGACVVALGTDAAGLFCNDEELAARIEKAGDAYFERVWRLPLWAHMTKLLESPIADLKNCGPREGGTLTAANFLQEFVDEGRKWAHIDMAALDNADNAVNPKGGTGFGVRILTDIAFME